MKITTFAIAAVFMQILCGAAAARSHPPAAVQDYLDAATWATYHPDAVSAVPHRLRAARHRWKRPATARRRPPVSVPLEATKPAPRPIASVEAPSPADGAPIVRPTILADYAYAESVPEKPALIALAELKPIPVGSPREEVDRAADAFGLDRRFMRTVARIESDFQPTQRTGSYVGLFQLSRHEFDKYGAGSITNARDNAVAAAFKFVVEAVEFESATGKIPTFSDLYLIHQQGEQGAAEHVAHPERLAWRSMCATDEGKQKGEGWCKRAIWGNTLPAIKRLWRSVENLTSGAFVEMWRSRVADFTGATVASHHQAAARPRYARRRWRHAHYAKS